MSQRFDVACALVLADVRGRYPHLTDEEALCHVFTAVDLADLRKLPIPHASREGTEDAAAVARHNELVDAYRRVLGRRARPSHDQLVNCLAALHHLGADELPLVQRAWLLQACRGDLVERTPTRAQLINLVRALNTEGRVRLTEHQERWAQQASLYQLV